MVLTEPQILSWLGRFLWPFLRITGLFLTSPFYGSGYIPGAVKAMLVAALATALAFWLPNLPAFPGDPPAAIFQGIIQIGFGAVLGLAMQIVVATVASAGELVGLSIGLGFAELQFRESNSSTPVLYDMMYWTGLMGFIAAGGPIWLFAALAHSFQNGIGVGSIASWNDLLPLGGTLFTVAVWLALPVLAVSLTVNITVGLTTVFAPQMNLLTIGFPLLILVGLWVFLDSIGYISQDFQHLLELATRQIGVMLSHG